TRTARLGLVQLAAAARTLLWVAQLLTLGRGVPNISRTVKGSHMSEHTLAGGAHRTGRREFLRLSILVGAGAATGLLAACAPGTPPAPAATAVPAAPV